MTTRRLRPYEPTEADLAWARQLLRVLKDGATWGTTAGTYKVDKTNKTITLTDPADPWDNVYTLAMLHRHTYVWRRLGYEVLPRIDWEHDPRFEMPDPGVGPGDLKGRG
jgi:hypothetical protein